jgi:hypothetical protein
LLPFDYLSNQKQRVNKKMHFNKFFCRRGLQWRRLHFLIFFLPKLSSFIDWCYYTQVSYTGSWEPLVCLSFLMSET